MSRKVLQDILHSKRMTFYKWKYFLPTFTVATFLLCYFLIQLTGLNVPVVWLSMHLWARFNFSVMKFLYHYCSQHFMKRKSTVLCSPKVAEIFVYQKKTEKKKVAEILKLVEEIFVFINLSLFLPVPISLPGMLSNMAQRVLYVSLVTCKAS